MTERTDAFQPSEPWLEMPPELKRKQWNQKARLMWILLALAGVLVLLAFAVYRCSPVITLRGEPEVTLEYGTVYKDAGAKASLVGMLFIQNGRPLELMISSNVDEQVLGSYTVTYETVWLDRTAVKVRTVQVVDTQAPEITLSTDPEHYTVPGDAYQEEGFSAWDNYDGDLTGAVTAVEQDGTVTYTVTDSSGNRTEIRREINYDDPIAPELILAGEGELIIHAGQTYQEPGYTASDNCDGDLTAQVTVTGEVDTNTPGTYELQYQVSDSYGNTAQASRTVTVQAIVEPPVEKPVGGVIYLTFDDGPGKHTGRLLDTLAKYGAKATFFVIDNGNYDTLRRIVNEGHAIALHSSSHRYNSIYASEEAFFNDLNSLRATVLRETGVDTTLMRFPGGSSNTVSNFNPGIMSRLVQAVTEQGYTYFDWNVDSYDAGGARNANQVYTNVISRCSSRTSSVVLQHDIKGFSVDAVEQILSWGTTNGYTFLALDPSAPTAHHGIFN